MIFSISGSRVLPVLASGPVLPVDPVFCRRKIGDGHNSWRTGSGCQRIEQQIQVQTTDIQSTGRENILAKIPIEKLWFIEP